MDLKKRIKKIGNLGKGYDTDNIYDPSGISPTIKPAGPRGSQFAMSPKIVVSNVSMPMNGINMPVKSTEKTLEIKSLSKEILGQFQPSLFQITTCSLGDFPAKLSVLLENEKDLEILVELSSLKYAELWKRRNLIFFSLKTSKGYLITMGGTRSELSSVAFQNWGMTVNGKCLTARISESRKTGKECSLLDILEEQVEDKYFLSEKMVKFLLNDRGKFPPQLLQDTSNKDNQTRMSLKKARQILDA